jgi:hypothetical protein
LHQILTLQYENDFVKQTDVNRLKITVTNLKTQRETLENGIRIQERMLKILAGIGSETVMQLDTAGVGNDGDTQPPVTAYVAELLPTTSFGETNELAMLQEKSIRRILPKLAAYGQFNYSSYATKFDLTTPQE